MLSQDAYGILLAPAFTCRGRFPFIFPSLFHFPFLRRKGRQNRPGVFFLAILLAPFLEAYGLLFRVHPEVLRISLHKPPQRCGGIFSTLLGIGGAGLFLFFPYFKWGLSWGALAKRLSLRLDFPTAGEMLLKDFSLRTLLLLLQKCSAGNTFPSVGGPTEKAADGTASPPQQWLLNDDLPCWAGPLATILWSYTPIGTTNTWCQ